MGKNKNKTKKYPKQNRRNKITLGFIKEALTLLGGLAGSILAIYGLVKTFKDDAEGFSWLIFVGVGLWLYLLWRLFQVRKTMAYSLFIVSVLAGILGWVGWQSQVSAIQKKVIVLVAQFDGPEETYGLRKQIMEELRDATKGYSNTIIIDGENVVTSGQGSEYARKLGEKEKADLVIWAWYQPTENPNITVHVENLSKNDWPIIAESETYQPSATIKDLETFEIQKQIGTETTKLISVLVGYVSLKSHDCEKALPLFDTAVLDGEIGIFVHKRDVLFLSAECHFELRNYELAIKNYDEIIREDPSNSDAYMNRGGAYFELGQKEDALTNFNKAVEVNPNSVDVYLGRARYFNLVNEFQNSFDDVNKAFELDPNNLEAYIVRANTYNTMGQFEKASQDLQKAIEIDPNNTVVLNNIGGLYNNIGQYKLAIIMYNKAIKIDSQDAIVYMNRGYSYSELGNYKQAINDFTTSIQLNPNEPYAYYNRSAAYRKIGETGKADADFKKYEELTGQKP